MNNKLILVCCAMLLLSIVPVVAANDYVNLDVTYLNQDPDPAQPGEILEVRWKVEKTGNGDADVVFRIDDVEYPLRLLDAADKERKIGSWKGWSDDEAYAVLLYRFAVDDATPKGTADIRLSYSVDGGNQWSQLEEYQIAVSDEASVDLITSTLRTSPQNLVADTDNAQLNVEMANIGDEAAENVQVWLNLPQGFSASYGYSNQDALGTIAADQSATAQFYVDVAENLKETEYNTDLTVRYKEADDSTNTYKEKKIPITIELTARPLFEIINVEEKSPIVPGEKTKVIVTVKNVGNDDAESVSLRAFKDSTQPFDFMQKSDFIGKLEPGQEGQAMLEFAVDEAATAKKYLLDVEIRSIQEDNVLLDQKVVPITVEEKSKRVGLLTGTILDSIIGLIIGALVGFFFAKRKYQKTKRR